MPRVFRGENRICCCDDGLYSSLRSLSIGIFFRLRLRLPLTQSTTKKVLLECIIQKPCNREGKVRGLRSVAKVSAVVEEGAEIYVLGWAEEYEGEEVGGGVYRVRFFVGLGLLVGV